MHSRPDYAKLDGLCIAGADYAYLVIRGDRMDCSVNRPSISPYKNDLSDTFRTVIRRRFPADPRPPPSPMQLGRPARERSPPHGARGAQRRCCRDLHGHGSAMAAARRYAKRPNVEIAQINSWNYVPIPEIKFLWAQIQKERPSAVRRLVGARRRGSSRRALAHAIATLSYS